MSVSPLLLEPLALLPAGYARASFACALFVVLLFVGAKVLPGPTYSGFRQPDGNACSYKLNGMALFVATHMAVVTAHLQFGLSPSALVRDAWELFIVANAFALIVSLALLFAGRRRPGYTATPGVWGWIKDFWYGAELNPNLFGVDLKTFAYQPSLIGLGLLNVAFGFAQYERYGSLTPQMCAYQAFWWLYLFTHYRYERGILSMWDVIAEKFGFMLVWGDLVLVPFFYCIGGWFLVDAREPVSWAVLAPVAALHVVGLWIFRASNAQKDNFKRNPTQPIWGKPPQTLGGKLLVSGFWGLGRKINYTGEICVYFSFALCTGFHSVVPYLLPLWLCILLPHRAYRDEERCRAKYGALWDEYTRIAKFKMIPFLY